MDEKRKAAAFVVAVAIPALALALLLYAPAGPSDGELERLASEAVCRFLTESSESVDEDVAAARSLLTGEALVGYQMSLEAVAVRHGKPYADLVRERQIRTLFEDVKAERQRFAGEKVGPDGPFYVAVAGKRTIRSADGKDLTVDPFIYLVRVVRADSGGERRLLVEGLADYQEAAEGPSAQ